ncbi:MAG TPA: fructosamine kinase family protein [Gammaproteobacteria bacterium]|jgi:fructosamine-3-kinase|nr:fructosamine kinase family protein [Gammaproteobacteria bacterium]
MPDWQQIIASAIADASGGFRLTQTTPVGGGDINEAWRFDGDGASWFVKLNSASHLGMFTAERDALDELARADAVRVPRPLCLGQSADRAYLVLEWFDLTAPTAASEAELGRALARQHRSTAERFGWHRDNTIGSTPQANGWLDNWSAFWRERRLAPQLDLAAAQGHAALREQAAPLLAQLDGFFSDYQPRPSLLHGDLWGGNRARLADATPVIFDPATYYGDREADIAMTELFGRFGDGFYDAYNREWPLDAGYGIRRDLYNLYHILNHLNLFGGGYAASAARLIERLVRRL